MSLVSQDTKDDQKYQYVDINSNSIGINQTDSGARLQSSPARLSMIVGKSVTQKRIEDSYM